MKMGPHHKVGLTVMFLFVFTSLQLFFSVKQMGHLPSYRLKRSIFDEWNVEEFRNTSRIKVRNVFVIVMCSGNETGEFNEEDDDIRRQIEQAATMIKSAVFFTSETLRFVVFTDTKELFNHLEEKLKTTLSEKYMEKVILEYQGIWYPKDRKNLRALYRPCATERLFLTELLNYDSVIYIDTDMLFLRPPEDLWKEFEYFGKAEVAGLCPALSQHYATKSEIPFYGKRGLNAGIMPMNLTRLDHFPGGWSNVLMETWDIYKESITLADQDIINIVFSQYPYHLYDLSCDWNFVGYGCYLSSSLCIDAQKYGISILHGNSKMFHQGAHLHFKMVYRIWQYFPVDKDIDFFWALMAENLKKIKASACPRINNFSEIIIKRSTL